MKRVVSKGTGPLALGGLLLAAVLGCEQGREPAADVGTVHIAILQAPADVRCIRVNAVGTRAVTSSTTVAVGQATSAIITLAGLPLGSTTFTADAFPVVCTSVVAATIPTWVSESVTTFVSANEVATLTLVMHRPGGASVSVDFPGAVSQKRPAASELVGSGAQARSTSFRMVSTLGQPTQNQNRSTSANFQLRGGLTAANGSTP